MSSDGVSRDASLGTEDALVTARLRQQLRYSHLTQARGPRQGRLRCEEA